tara:strand:+ start:66 stop:833 length:768 start_codon:yes stop_codon:yes gene_type:complete
MSSFYINDYEFSNFSQNGEDGIIELLSKYLINNNYYFAEVGCGNGLENNSTNLVLDGWSGVVFDVPSNIYQYRRLLKIIQPTKEIKYASGKISLSNIEQIINILKNYQIDFFSLDIDSYDFYIMQEILRNNIFPQIICVEYNSFLGTQPITVKYVENFQRYKFDKKRGLYFGSSLNAWKVLFEKYNYKFVCVDKNGINAFFILPNNFKKEFNNFKGLQFEYTKTFINKYGLSGEVLEKELLLNFKDEFINIKSLI